MDFEVGMLAVAMGLQTTAARMLGVPDLTTTVVTLTMTALASESFIGTGANRNTRQRLNAVAAMFVGAVLGGALVLHRGVGPALGLTLALLIALCASIARASAGFPDWAKPN